MGWEDTHEIWEFGNHVGYIFKYMGWNWMGWDENFGMLNFANQMGYIDAWDEKVSKLKAMGVFKPSILT